MTENLTFILLMPLLAAVLILTFLRKSPKAAQTASIASALFCLAALLKMLLAEDTAALEFFSVNFPLFYLGDFVFYCGYLFDSLSANMLFVVCFVGFLIHIFSVGYMDKENAKPRFFGGLSFFMFSMTGIVLADNLLMMFLFWEFVGFSSYMLIAYYADTAAAREASKKAFIVNRVGDFGFLLGIIWCWHSFGTVNFVELGDILGADPTKASTAMGALIMCGFLGKSAQFPLQVWLTDAMAGPTPVSALIHAATMVAAGIFMMSRLGLIGFLTPEVLDVTLILGSFMALFAGIWALGQTDIKKTLAYSTLAHLGLMAAAVGLGLYGVAMFHLTMHAFFKAALFLTAGSVIHACHHEQDMFKMGGLFKKMPITGLVTLAASLSIISTPFFAGYYSKDLILNCAFAKASAGHSVVALAALAAALGGAFMTAIYTARLFCNVFLGKPQSEKASHAHESSLWMTLPLIVLAVFSVGGAWGIIYGFEWADGLMSGLMPSFASAFAADAVEKQHEVLESVAHLHSFEVGTLIMVAVSLVIGLIVYGRNRGADPLQKTFPRLFAAVKAHGWFDDVYDYYVAKVQQRIASLLSVLDLLLLHQIVIRGSCAVVAGIGEGIKRLHAARAYSYARWVAAGVVLIFIILIA